MFDWNRFRVGSLAVELNGEFEVYEFLKIALSQSVRLLVNDFEAYVTVMQRGYKYFYVNGFREICVANNVNVYNFNYVVKYSDVFSGIFPSKESLMEFLNGE